MSTPTVSPCPPTLSERVEVAAKLIVAVPGIQKEVGDGMDDAKGYICNRLAVLGIYSGSPETDAESLKLLLSDDCPEGEARRVFCENGEPNLPVVRFKAVWRVLKDVPEAIEVSDVPDATVEALKEMVRANRFHSQWSDRELLAAYTPDAPAELVEALNRRANGRAFIIFVDEKENVLDIEASLRLLREARRRETPVHFKVADCLKRLYRAGEFPSLVHLECPFHSGVLLMDGYCDECGHSWEGVSYEVMQFARMVRDAGEAPKSSPGVRQFIHHAMGGLQTLRRDYPKVGVSYEEAEVDCQLPSLRRRQSERRVSDPMSPMKRY